jgi:uncharacterized membrane protein
MISASSMRDRLRGASAGRRVAAAGLAGVLAGAILSLFTLPMAAVLLGWDAATVCYLSWVWGAVWRLDSRATARLANQEDPSTAVADLVVVGAGTSTLAAVGLALVKAGRETGSMKGYLIAVGVLSVVLSWTVVHTVFMLRYARAYYSPPTSGIEFGEGDTPTYMDFAYFSFTIGMTYQVSDTNITSRPIRRTVLYQALLSYLFGAVILGLAINVVASLLR